ncbi:phosphoribosylaminoimidazole-succinocarboxamide synthase, partial [sediment metagenome]
MTDEDKILEQQLRHALADIDFPGLGQAEHRGTTDLYRFDDYVLVVVTDRAASSVGTIPFKGQVITRMNTWWL